MKLSARLLLMVLLVSTNVLQAQNSNTLRLQIGTSLGLPGSSSYEIHPQSTNPGLFNAHSSNAVNPGLYIGAAYEIPFSKRTSLELTAGVSQSLWQMKTIWSGSVAPNEIVRGNNLLHQWVTLAELGGMLKIQAFKNPNFRLLFGLRGDLPFASRFTRIGDFAQSMQTHPDNGTFPDTEMSIQPSLSGMLGAEWILPGKKRDYTLQFQVSRQLLIMREKSELMPKTNVRVNLGIPIKQ